MALKQSLAKLPRAIAFALVVVALASTARGEDSRAERARQVRDEILAKRRDAAPRPMPPREDPIEAAVTAARERLATIDAQIEEMRRRSERQAAPREQLAARSEQLQAAATRLEEENRGRVEAIYRSAKLGAGAAGWHSDPARSARLSRYLASIAAVQDRRLEVVEVEHGSAIAALDRARAEDTAAAAELRVLAADRTEAEARLDHALVEAGQGRIDGADGIAEHYGAAGNEFLAAHDGVDVDEAIAADEAEDPGEEVVATADDSEQIAAERAAEEGELKAMADELAASEAAAAAAVDRENIKAALEPAPSADAEGAPPDEELDASARQVERALLELAAKTAQARATARQADVAGDKDPAINIGAGVAPGLASAPPSPQAADTAGPAAAGAPATPGAAATTNAVAAVSGNPPGAPTNAPAGDAAEPAGADTPAVKPRGLLSRIFGSDKDSDAFSASRGTLPPPVAGKVVANYGQQHKSGATYRGVILRAGHSEPIKAVAAGKVSFAGNVPGLGNTVIVSHGGRYHTVYARLGSVRVKEGESIKPGSALGALPDDNADMHFELRDQGKAIDPLPWLKSGIPGAAP